MFVRTLDMQLDRRHLYSLALKPCQLTRLLDPVGNSSSRQSAVCSCMVGCLGLVNSKGAIQVRVCPVQLCAW